MKSENYLQGSKYVANRVLILSALANGKSRIQNIPKNNDINDLLNVLKKLNVNIVSLGKSKNEIIIEGLDILKKNKCKRINVKESGTLLRFILGVSCLLKRDIIINASKRNKERPIQPLIKSLIDLGAKISVNEKNIFPIKVGFGLKGGKTVIDGSISSQFISSLLIIAPYAEKDVEIKVIKPIVSYNYIDLTIKCMKEYGVKIRRYDYKDYELFKIKSNQRYLPTKLIIPIDWSSANYLFAEAAILNKTITIKNLDFKSNKGEAKFINILGSMGCNVKKNKDSISIINTPKLKGVNVDMKDSPDSVLTLIAVALFAKGKTIIKNIEHLKYKECNRIKDMEDELRKIDANITTTNNSITIVGSCELKAGIVRTHKDHRLAMCLGLIQLKNKKMKIINRKCVGKSFPKFWDSIKILEDN